MNLKKMILNEEQCQTWGAWHSSSHDITIVPQVRTSPLSDTEYGFVKVMREQCAKPKEMLLATIIVRFVLGQVHVFIYYS